MRNFKVFELAKMFRQINKISIHAQSQCDSGHRDDYVPANHIELMVKPIIEAAQQYAKDVELDSTRKRVCDFGPFSISAEIGITYQDLVHELEVLRQSVEADLEDRTFIFIAASDAKIAKESVETWAAVWGSIPESVFDSKEAISCYAFDRNTATVFHLMRTAEYGLRHLARKLHVKVTHTKKAMPAEFADWEKVIVGIKNKIDAVRKLPIGSKRQEQLEKYSDAADHCVYMKDIWRNNIAHARRPYKKTEALNVLERVRDFMQFVASNFK